MHAPCLRSSLVLANHAHAWYRAPKGHAQAPVTSRAVASSNWRCPITHHEPAAALLSGQLGS